MSSRRNAIGASTTLATADDLDGTVDNSQVLSLKGGAGAVILQLNNGTNGTAGIDVIEYSRDGGTTYKAATAANIGNGHGGLRTSAGTAVASAALNAAGAEPAGAAIFFLAPMDGVVQIRCARLTTTTNGTTWVTGSPQVIAFRMG